MKVRAAMLAALLGLGAGSLGAGSAQAQARWSDDAGYYQGLPARVIVRAVRSRGLMPISRIMRRGDLYYVDAADGYGRVRRVMIDAYSGRVVRIETTGRPHRGGHVPPLTRAQPREDDMRGEDAMRPPRAERRLPPPQVIPADPQAADPRLPPRERVGGLPPLRPRAGIPGATPRTAAVSPTRPPTPRPRPETAPAQATLPGAPSEAPAAAAPNDQAVARPKPLPRVILPGGPLPKAERTAETRPGQRIQEEAGESAAESVTGSTATPMAAPQAASPEEKPVPDGMPPMQSFD